MATVPSISPADIASTAKVAETHSSSENQLFKSKENLANLKTCISLLRSDRMFDQNKLTDFLMENLEPAPRKMEDNPFLAMLWMTLNNDSLADREKAEDFYIEKFGKEDPKFERGYTWARNPHVLIAHYLLSKGEWICENPASKDFYDDQMAGMFSGEAGFDPGARLTHLEYLKIKEKGWAPKVPETEETYLTKLEGASPLESPTYVVKKWFGTPALNRHSSTEGLFTHEAIGELNTVKQHILKKLNETSALAKEKLGVPANSVVAAIGSPGAGKSSFISNLLSSDSVFYYSMDCIKDAFASKKSSASKTDYHFVASKVRWSFADVVKREIPVLVAETPATDASLVSRLLRDYSGRENKFIYEVALLNPLEAVERKLSSNPGIDRGYLQVSAENAQKNRSKSIATFKAVDNLVHKLYTNEQTEGKKPNFVLVAETRDKETKVVEGQEANYKALTS